MQLTSPAYQEEMARQYRGQTFIRVMFGAMDVDAATTITARQAATGLYFSTLDGLELEGAVPLRTYATFEPGRMLADGALLVAPALGESAAPQGYVSELISGADGAFSPAPFVDFSFSKTHSVIGLTFVFDRSCGDYPARLRVEAWRGGECITSEVCTPTGADYEFIHKIDRFDRLRFTWLASAVPYRRARLQQVLFGLGIRFDGSTVEKATWKDEVDPLSRKLPTGDFSFTVTDPTGMYDPDAPQGIWEYIDLRSPVDVALGQRITRGLTWADLFRYSWFDAELNDWGTIYEGGSTEWVPCGRYYLTAQPTLDNMSVTFACKAVLSLADTTYSTGVWRPGGITLYDLALDVLRAAGLPEYQEGVPYWHLWDGLKNITTTAPLPKSSCRECLQLIANAACCVLYTDRSGYIHLEPQGGTDDPLYLDFGTQIQDTQTVSKLPTLQAVRARAYTYAPKAEEPRELVKTPLTLSGTTTLHLEYSAAANVSVTVTPATVGVHYTAYTYGMELTLTGSGPVEVVVTGVELESSSELVRINVPDADENGEVETISNPLITSTAQARAVARWTMDYLLNRSTYEAEYRGDPSLDAGDGIDLQSRFATRFPTLLLAHELDYDGTIAGKITTKRMVTKP